MYSAKGIISSLRKRKKSNFLFLGMGMMLCLIILSCQRDPETRGFAGIMAPDFNLADLDGNAFHLEGERGKMVLIIFTTTWCPACTGFIPICKEIQEVYGKEKDFVMVNIDIEESLDRVRAFAKANGIAYRILLDSEGEVRKGYNIMGVPSFVLINGEGKIISSRIERILDILQTTFSHV